MKSILFMLAALPLLAAGNSAHFAGRVFDGNGTRELSGAIVTVTTPSGFISSVVTDKSGNYSFASLPGGEYDFRVTAHGFAIYERQITISSDAGVKELDIRMMVPANKQTVSVAELQRLDISQSAPANTESARRGY